MVGAANADFQKRSWSGMNGQVIRPYALSIEEARLADLKHRLDLVRWPDAETAGGWEQGVPLSIMRDLHAYWRDEYDWRRCEAELNRTGQFVTGIDGLDIHFLHIRSPEAGALPLILTHGWPGSIIEFMDVIGPLADPASHGGRAEDAFHVVLPSIPGYGFSGHPVEEGWNTGRIAGLWAKLMERLGYDRYVAQGGDWGAIITRAMASQKVRGCAAIHLNLPMVVPNGSDLAGLTPQEQAILSDMENYRTDGIGYASIQSTRPQTLGYSLADSPIGQAAWVLEKFHGWSDHDGDVIAKFGYDRLLDNIMLYWLPNTGASSAQLYRESLATAFDPVAIDLPVGISIFPKEAFRCSRRWAERDYANLIHWNELERGGHFAAMEQPEAFVDEVRACFRAIR